jgi:Protein of unknown function (DUF1552)
MSVGRMRVISRRAVLRGVGTALALPWLEAMAADKRRRGGPPIRMAFLYVPNGAHMPDWTPAEAGPGFSITPILEPLAPFRRDILVLSGLAQDKARDHGDGPGDHARSLATFLTGVHPRKTDGANIRVGISADQLAAQTLGRDTRLPSLELGCDESAQSGNCDSGYSCAYSSNISWRSESTPMAKEVDPRLVFDRLFSNDAPAEAGTARGLRQHYRKSILDLVADDARRLDARLGGADRRKIDEYLTSIRELERRINASSAPAKPPKGAVRPSGIPADYREHIRLMLDLMALAFQADVTRVATFLYANEASNRSYQFLGVAEGHHDISHHGGDREKQRKIRTINRFHVEQFAYFLGKLKAAREGNQTLLDRVMIVYGSGISDGNSHDHGHLPVLLAGRGGGTIVPGRHLLFPGETPLNNLFLSMLDRVGVEVPYLGDSTGRLPFLS